MVKIVRPFTISTENSDWLAKNFANQSSQVDKILTEFRENSTDFYQKIAKNQQKIKEIEQENEFLISQVRVALVEAELEERKKAQKYLKDIKLSQEKKVRLNKEIFEILSQTGYIEKLKFSRTTSELSKLCGEINHADDYSTFLPCRMTISILQEVSLLIEKNVEVESK